MYLAKAPLRTKRNVILITAAVLLVIIALPVVLFGMVSNEATSSCTDRQERLDRTAAELRRLGGGLRIAGQVPAEVSAEPSGDCLTGSGSTLTASFILELPSVSDAHDKTRAALGLPADPQATVFKGEYDSTDASPGGSSLAGVNARIRRDRDTYDISYRLREPAGCLQPGQQTCTANTSDQAVLQRLGAMDRPVGRVVVTVERSINDY